MENSKFIVVVNSKNRKEIFIINIAYSQIFGYLPVLFLQYSIKMNSFIIGQTHLATAEVLFSSICIY